MNYDVVGLVIAALLAVFTSITAPLLLLYRTERMHREDREEEYRRQDERAARLAGDVLRNQEILAEHTAEVAQQAAAANTKLDEIHTLVNSNMTAAMQSEYDAIARELAMMREVMDLKRSMGHQPTRDALVAIEATKEKLHELGAKLTDRKRAQAAVEAKKAEEDSP